MRKLWQKLLAWYHRHRQLHVGISAALFATQIVHLVWLTGNAVWPRLFGFGWWEPSGLGQALIAGADYLEVPAIISTSLLYLGDLGQQFKWQTVRLLAYINSQWVHIYWITDEVVLESFNTSGGKWPVWAAWAAIAIDYLELPVIYDTSKQFIQGLLKRQPAKVFKT